MSTPCPPCPLALRCLFRAFPDNAPRQVYFVAYICSFCGKFVSIIEVEKEEGKNEAQVMRRVLSPSSNPPPICRRIRRLTTTFHTNCREKFEVKYIPHILRDIPFGDL